MNDLSVIEKCKIIRKEIKSNLGFSSRQVSITSHRSLYDDTILIKIKNIKATRYLNEISKIANCFENISYDERTYETLLGGNTFVNITVDFEVFDELTESYLSQAKEVLNRMSQLKVNSCYDIQDGLLGILDDVYYNIEARTNVYYIKLICVNKQYRNNLYCGRLMCKCKNEKQLANALAQYNYLGEFIC